jgi:hypothetical protein
MNATPGNKMYSFTHNGPAPSPVRRSPAEAIMVSGRKGSM